MRLPGTSTAARPADLRLRQQAQALADALPALMLRAERAAASVIHGLHGRRQSGPGEDFWQYRPYMPGDAATQVDWRKSARAERVYIRETEWMAANTLWLWVQADAGMNWRSHLSETTKAERAFVLALALARLAISGGERVGLIGAPFAPDHTKTALERAGLWLWRQMHQAQASLPGARPLPRFSTCVLIGDFFAADEETLHQRLRALASLGARGALLQVVDPAEETFPFSGRVRFVDARSDAQFLSERAEDLRADYARALENMRARLTALARRLGWTFHTHRTDQPPQAALLALHARLSGAPAAAGGHHQGDVLG